MNREQPILFLTLFLYQLCLFVGLSPLSPYTIVPMLAFTTLLLLSSWRDKPGILATVLSKQLFWLIWAGMAITWIGLVFVEYYSVEYSNFDTGIYANGVAIFWQTGNYFSSILNMPALGEHFTPNLLLLAPLLGLKLSFLWFPILKVIAFLVCPFILYRFGQRILGDESALLWTAPILFCCHSYVMATVAMEFQPSGLALPFVLLAFLFAFERRYFPLTITLLFLLGFKEHMALIWVSVGFYLALVNGRKTTGAIYAILGLAAGLLIYTVVMPYCAGGLSNSHAHRFAPFAMLSAKASLLFKAFLSVGFLPLLRPRILPAIICGFGIALVSNDPLMLTFTYHYQDIALAVLLVGVLHGLQALSRYANSLHSSRIKRVALACLGIFVLNLHNHYPARIIRWEWPTADELKLVGVIEATRMTLRHDRPLWTLNSIGPYFFDYQNLRPIIHPEPPFTPDSQIILSAGVGKWPLSEEQYARTCVAAERTNGALIKKIPE